MTEDEYNILHHGTVGDHDSPDALDLLQVREETFKYLQLIEVTKAPSYHSYANA